MSVKIPVVVFMVTFLATLVLVVLLAKVYDREPPLPPIGAASLTPFPNIAPVVPPPAVAAGPGSTACLSLVANATGHYEPSPLSKLRACASDTDCATCSSSPIQILMSCQTPSSDMADAQDALDNPGSKYCLPTPKTCLPTSATEGTLVACTHDADCGACDDALGDGQAMQCEIVSSPKKISVSGNTVDDATQIPDDQIVDVPTGQWCLPKTGLCHPDNGVLHWTTAGWSCTCRYPAVHGGAACDVLKACNIQLTTDWSAGNQQLLVNQEGSGEEVWSITSGINPMLCHARGTPKSDWDKPCGPDTVPNAVCQCDGLMRESHMGFRNETTDPLTCTPDSCSVNALGGHAIEPLVMSDWSPGNAPPTQCVCSGADSRIWDIDTRDPAIVEPELAETLRLQQGYVYTGRCEDTTIATNGALVVLPAHEEHANSVACSYLPNKHAEITSLVPGLAVDEFGTASVSVCAADPCRGKYSDVNFKPPDDVQDKGHYSTVLGECDCTDPSRAVDTSETVNPVGSVCVDACVGMESPDETEWPCRQDPNNPCPLPPVCNTGENGEAVCTCPAGCGNIDGITCAQQFEIGEACTGYIGSPNVCKPGENGEISRCMCHQGRKRDSVVSSCTNTPQWYALCTTDLSNEPSCHTGSTHGLAKCGGEHNPLCGDEPGCSRVA